jgi:hypothetical protein
LVLLIVEGLLFLRLLQDCDNTNLITFLKKELFHRQVYDVNLLDESHERLFAFWQLRAQQFLSLESLKISF